MPSSGPDWTDGTGSSNYSGCTLFCETNTKCLNFADNFIELTGAYLLSGRPWDERCARYYRCRHAHMMRYGQSYTHRWGGEWSAGWHLMEVGTKRTVVIDYGENWRQTVSVKAGLLSPISSLTPLPPSPLYFWTQEPRDGWPECSRLGEGIDCCCCSRPHTPSGTGTLQWRSDWFCRLG